MYIKNRSQLLSEDLKKSELRLRKLCLDALELGLDAIRPQKLIEKSIEIRDNNIIIEKHEFNLNNYDKIYLIGGGKATAEMAFALAEIFQKNSFNYEGIINVQEGLEIDNSALTGNITLNFATHPIPNDSGLNGVKMMMKLVKKSTEKDLIFCLISGGGSALLPLPKKGISLTELQNINSLLLTSGASIHEMNIIRKHLSDIKGGNLAKKSKGTIISLIISDVVGDNLDSIASGPTVPDLSTFKDVLNILKKYNLLDKIPSSAEKIIKEGLQDKALETPKSGDKCFQRVHNFLIGSVKSAAEKVISFLEENNFETFYFSNQIVGESNEFGKELYGIIQRYLEKKSEKIALIASGELTVTIKGKGIGGRNQEMLLSFLDFVKDKDFIENFLIIGVNLDGIEGNSKAMGAIIDNTLLNTIKERNLNTRKYLENNDSNGFFKLLNSEIITGLTGLNVNDLLIILILKNV